MTDELKKALEQLRTIAPKLNKATDQATAVVQQVESFLNDECKIGIPAEVVVESTHRKSEDERGLSEEYDDVLVLGYGRVGGNVYRIYVERRAESQDRDGDVTVESLSKAAWLESTRDRRLASFPELPALLTEIAKEAQRMSDNADKATAAVESLLSAMKK